MDRALIALLLLAAVALGVTLLRRTRTPSGPGRVDPAEVGLPGGGVRVVQFSSPWCHSCRRWHVALESAGVQATEIDVSKRPALARRYGVGETPLVIAARARDGLVLAAYAGDPEPARVERLAELTGAGRPD